MASYSCQSARWKESRSSSTIGLQSPCRWLPGRAVVLLVAAKLFAERGFKNTTVRDIADAAGILSGSLYHHFDSKEAMVDELLDSFQTALWQQYDAIEASDRPPKEKLEAVVRVSFDAIDQHHSEVAIFQNDAAYLGDASTVRLPRRSATCGSATLWTGLLREGVAAGELRADLDVELVYRFLRDTVWVAVRWYRPGGDLTPEPGRRPVPAHPARRDRSWRHWSGEILVRLQQRAWSWAWRLLVEVHDDEELSRAIDGGARIVGVNNRNLRTLAVDVAASRRLGAHIPADVIGVSESGLTSRAELERLAVGYRAFLIGERFMTAPDPAKAIAGTV